MKELSIEEKARAYDEAIEKLRDFYRDYDTVSCLIDVKEELANLFPALKESEDEKIKKEIISFIQDAIDEINLKVSGDYDDRDEDDIAHQNWCKKAIAWLENIPYTIDHEKREGFHLGYKAALEKQGENCLVNFDEAEKEKYDFVSGQFIECRKSFNGFKEDNSYWLEYIGDDNYIGRSDNILNQKFHITPRQLFTLFTWQHRPKENNVNEETNAPTGYGKYVDECLNEASKHFFSEGEDKYSVADLFYAGVRCGKSWLEKQGVQKVSYTTLVKMGDGGINALVTRELPAEDCDDEQKPVDEAEPKFHIGDKIRIFRKGSANEEPMTITKIDGKGYWSGDLFLCNFTDADRLKLVERKPADKVEPKFKVGDWVVQGCNIMKIRCVCNEYYCFETVGGYVGDMFVSEVDSLYHLWTIQDAKAGDVIYLPNGNNEYYFFIFKGIENATVMSFAHFYKYNNGTSEVEGTIDNLYSVNDVFQPATKEQRDLLFKKMKDAGYEWDAEKKELKKIEQKPTCSDDKKLTDVNHEYFNELLENNNSKDINDYAYQVAYCMSHDWANETPTWDDVQKACKLGAKWKEKHHKSKWNE